jgi:hypothetical protein
VHGFVFCESSDFFYWLRVLGYELRVGKSVVCRLLFVVFILCLISNNLISFLEA